MKLLYGIKGIDFGRFKLPSGHTACHSLPSSLGGLKFSLSPQGHVSYNLDGQWGITVSMASAEFPSPDLFKADNFVSLRAENGEVGVSFDKTSARQFYTVVQPLPSPFTLQFKVCLLISLHFLTFCYS